MNKIQKKKLYESIMKSVSKTIKRKLNESSNIFIDAHEVYDELVSLLEAINKMDEIFKKNTHVRLFGYDNMKYMNNLVVIRNNKTGFECYDIDTLTDELDNNPASFENLNNLSIEFFIDDDESLAENNIQKYFYILLPDACEKIANKFNYKFYDDGLHISLYKDETLNTMDDLNNKLDTILEIQKNLYNAFAKIGYKIIMNKIGMATDY